MTIEQLREALCEFALGLGIALGEAESATDPVGLQDALHRAHHATQELARKLG